MLLMILMAKKLFKHFTRKNCKKQVNKSLELRKVIKRKGGKLYIKSKIYNNNSLNSWIDKKDSMNE